MNKYQVRMNTGKLLRDFETREEATSFARGTPGSVVWMARPEKKKVFFSKVRRPETD